MMTKDAAQAWAQEWVDAWNARDLERVLAHYADDFEMSSPYIVTIAASHRALCVAKPRLALTGARLWRRGPICASSYSKSFAV